MAHPRKQIRAAVVAMLDAATLTGTPDISDTRIRPAATYPAIMVQTVSDDLNELLDLGDRAFIRDLGVEIHIHHQKIEGLEAALDDLCRKIEDEVEGDPFLEANMASGPDIFRVQYQGTALEFPDEVDPESARDVITYLYTYQDDA